jgi:RNA-directed DNA polymerase
VLITASKESVNILCQKVHDICKQGKSLNFYRLIARLRPITLGWANYFCFAEWKGTANSTNHKLFQQSLRPWVFCRKAKKKGRQWIKEKYVPSNKCWTYQGQKNKDNWILYGEIMEKNEKKSTFLPHL